MYDTKNMVNKMLGLSPKKDCKSKNKPRFSVNKITTQQLRNEVRKLEEFTNYTNEQINNMSRTELGAILGYWDIGEGNERNYNY